MGEERVEEESSSRRETSSLATITPGAGVIINKDKNKIGISLMSFLYVTFQITLEYSFKIALVASIIETFMF